MRAFFISILLLLAMGSAPASATDISPVNMISSYTGDIYVWSNPHGIPGCSQGSAVVLQLNPDDAQDFVPTDFNVKVSLIATAIASGKKLQWQTVGCDADGYPIVKGVVLVAN